MCDDDGAQRFAARFRLSTPRVKHDIRPYQRICIELNFFIALPLCFDLGKRPQRHTERPILRSRRSEQRPHDDISAENGNADEKHLAEARFRQPFAHFLTDIHTYKRRHQTDEREQPKIRGQQTAAAHGNTERNG